MRGPQRFQPFFRMNFVVCPQVQILQIILKIMTCTKRSAIKVTLLLVTFYLFQRISKDLLKIT